jgi:hypothetical protein
MKEEGLLCMRPYHDEVIVVMAPPKPPIRCFYNSIMRDTLSAQDQAKLSWTGNLLCLTSSLQQEMCPDLGGISRYAMSALLTVSVSSWGLEGGRVGFGVQVWRFRRLGYWIKGLGGNPSYAMSALLM